MFKQLYLTYKAISPSLKLTIYMIVFLIISGIISLPLYLSEINMLKSIQSAINKVEDDVTKGKQLQARCSLPTENEKEVWNEMENEFSRSIPPEKKLLSLVKDIAKIAHDCSIYDISFSMPDANSTGNHSTISLSGTDTMAGPIPGAGTIPPTQGSETGVKTPHQLLITTSFHCRYRDLDRFLKGISDLPRVVKVDTLKIDRKLPLMSVKMTLNAFYAKEREDA